MANLLCSKPWPYQDLLSALHPSCHIKFLVNFHPLDHRTKNKPSKLPAHVPFPWNQKNPPHHGSWSICSQQKHKKTWIVRLCFGHFLLLTCNGSTHHQQQLQLHLTPKKQRCLWALWPWPFHRSPTWNWEVEPGNLLLPPMNHMPFTQALVLVAHIYPAVVLFHDNKWHLTSVSWNSKVIACQRCCIKFTLPAFRFFTFSSPSDSWGFFRVNQIYILRSLGISGSPAQTKLPKAPPGSETPLMRPVWSNSYATSFHKW